MSTRIEEALTKIGSIALKGVPEKSGYVFHANEVRDVLLALAAPDSRVGESGMEIIIGVLQLLGYEPKPEECVGMATIRKAMEKRIADEITEARTASLGSVGARELTPSELDKCLEDYDSGTIPRGQLLRRINALLAKPAQADQLRAALERVAEKLEADSLAWDEKNDDRIVPSAQGATDYTYGYNAGVSEGFRAASGRVLEMLSLAPESARAVLPAELRDLIAAGERMYENCPVDALAVRWKLALVALAPAPPSQEGPSGK